MGVQCEGAGSLPSGFDSRIKEGPVGFDSRHLHNDV
jgi:hypothetical protein